MKGFRAEAADYKVGKAAPVREEDGDEGETNWSVWERVEEKVECVSVFERWIGGGSGGRVCCMDDEDDVDFCGFSL